MKKIKLVALFGIKYEPEWMVDQLIENLSGWVDDFAIFDTRDRDELWIHEGEYRVALRDKAYAMNADWVLITSPDERWEDNAGDIIRPQIDDNKHKKILEFNLRELYTPTSYRVDGIWGQKVRRRMFPLRSGQQFAYQEIQCPSFPLGPDYRIVRSDVNIYHTKMIEPENRALRAAVFNKLDPNNRRQVIGYDYLDDESGMVLEEIEDGRNFYPPYRPFRFEVPEKYL